MLITTPNNTLRDPDISPAYMPATAKEVRVLTRILRHAETPEAIREFARCRNQLGDYAYWFTLGTLWVSYTGFSNLDLWKRLFSAQRPDRDVSLMKPSEYRALYAMPDEFFVLRAHRPDETDWIAYTLDTQIAARFAVERKVTQVHVYSIRRSDVLALFLRRGEKEVLVLDKTKARPVGAMDVALTPVTLNKEDNQPNG